VARRAFLRVAAVRCTDSAGAAAGR